MVHLTFCFDLELSLTFSQGCYYFKLCSMPLITAVITHWVLHWIIHVPMTVQFGLVNLLLIVHVVYKIFFTRKIVFITKSLWKLCGIIAKKCSLLTLQAVDELTGSEKEGRELHVGRTQKNAERQAELKERFERLKHERMNRYQGVNLDVKNLDDGIDDERLRVSTIITYLYKIGMQSFHIIVYCTPVYCTLVYCMVVTSRIYPA